MYVEVIYSKVRFVKHRVSVILALFVSGWLSGFGSLEVVCWPLVTKFTGSQPVEAVEFLG
jgi:hypothetical protein